MKKCTIIKSKVKALLKQIDGQAVLSSPSASATTHTDTVKDSLFFDILQLMGIKLTDADTKRVRLACGDPLKPGQIRYKDALAAVSINPESERPLESKWIVRLPNQAIPHSSETYQVPD